MRELLLFSVLFLTLFTGCRTPDFEPEEKDKLEAREKYALYDYARLFIRNSKKVKLSPSDLQVLKEDPVTRIHYTAPKKGRAILSWSIPGVYQIIAVAEGSLQLERGDRPEWKLRVLRYSRTTPKRPKNNPKK